MTTGIESPRAAGREVTTLSYCVPLFAKLFKLQPIPQPSQPTSNPQLPDCSEIYSSLLSFDPFSTAVLCRGQTSQFLSNLSPKRDCSTRTKKNGQGHAGTQASPAPRVSGDSNILDVLSEQKEKSALF